MRNFAMRYPLARIALGLFVAAATSLRTAAKFSEWHDAQGVSFRGEPAEVIGPFALFRTSGNGGRRMLLRGLGPAESQRFYQEISGHAPRALRWSDAKGLATSDLVDKVLRVESKKQMVPADLRATPEPELLVVLYGSHNDSESWQMVTNFIPTHRRIQRVYPGQVATVFIGIRHSALQHREISTESFMPWLVADFSEQSEMRSLVPFVPKEGTLMLLLSREGVPLLAMRATDLAAIRKFTDTLAEMLFAVQSSNPRSWEDRAAYFGAVRPLEFARATTGPMLVGDPLKVDVLRRYKVERVAAKMNIDASGKVQDATLQPDSRVPADLVAGIIDALQRQSVFLPGIAQGKPVAGSYDYTVDVPPENPALAADVAWMNSDIRREIPLPSWFILKPIHVSEQDFGVDHVEVDGKVVLKSVEVSDSKVSRASQMSAFNSDWFGPEGAGTVSPIEGVAVPIENDTPTWKRVAAKDGLVDFAGGIKTFNYCIGYAWTEFEVAEDTEAWLGIGSDDGVKVWHNGRLVDDQWIRRQSRIDDDIVPLHLKKGKNQLLIKIQNATGDWSFLCRLRTRGR